MIFPPLTFGVLDDTFAIGRLDSHASIPLQATACDFFSITRTADELSVCERRTFPFSVAPHHSKGTTS
jgi:hypothetical protein